jgi:5-methylcytosine-specific restriction endonuclease McrA
MSRHKPERKGPINHLFNEQSGLCCYCAQPMTLRLGKRHTATVEHIVPRSKGGANHISNYSCACFACNTERGNTNLLVFLAKRRQPSFGIWDH